MNSTANRSAEVDVSTCSREGCNNKFSLFKKDYHCWLCALKFCSDHVFKQRVCRLCNSIVHSRLSTAITETVQPVPLADEMRLKLEQEIQYLRGQLEEVLNHSASKESHDEVHSERAKRVAAENEVQQLLAEHKRDTERIEELERRLLSLKVEMENTRRSTSPAQMFPNTDPGGVAQSFKDLLQFSRMEVEDLKMKLKVAEESIRLYEQKVKQIEKDHTSTLRSLADNISETLKDAEIVAERERARAEQAERHLGAVKQDVAPIPRPLQYDRILLQALLYTGQLRKQLDSFTILETSVREMKTLVMEFGAPLTQTSTSIRDGDVGWGIAGLGGENRVRLADVGLFEDSHSRAGSLTEAANVAPQDTGGGRQHSRDLGTTAADKEQLSDMISLHSMDSLYSLGEGLPGLGSTRDDLADYLDRLPRGVNTELIQIGKSLTAAHARTIAAFLVANSNYVFVGRMSLSGNHLGDGGAKAIASCIANCPVLTRLDLRHNFIADEGVAALSRSIRESTVLTRLDLSGNSIGENGATETSRNSSFALAGAAHLAKMLQQNTVLTRLDIRHNAISSGSSYLAGALTCNSTLIQLDLGSNEIKPDGCIALARALEVNNIIRELDLRDNETDTDAANALQRALQSKSLAGERRVLWTTAATPR